MFEHDGGADDKPRGPKSLTYADSGVDLEKAKDAKERIKQLARSTFTPGVIGDIGAFGGLFRADFSRFQSPILISSADGVGTKLKVAFLTGIHNTVGEDIVSHCTNDILVQGALPLFFMDYIATGQLEPGIVAQIVEGLARGCRQSGCALLGGETAEMPDFYSAGEYDLAGFIVGVADERKLLGPQLVRNTDVLIALPSSGLHTNGYSLVRKLVFDVLGLDVLEEVPDLGRTVGEELLEPHKNYLPTLKELIQTDDLHAIAHITGGGIPGNLNRVLPDHLEAVVEEGSWDVLPVFRWLRERGSIDNDEMYRTFNMGVGIILIVGQDRLSRVEGYLQKHGERYYLIGQVKQGSGEVRFA